MSNNPSKSPTPKAPQGGPAKPAESKITQQSKAPATPPTPPAHVLPLFRGIDWWSFGITTLLVFLGYLWTLAPDLTLEDCGELATGS